MAEKKRSKKPRKKSLKSIQKRVGKNVKRLRIQCGLRQEDMEDFGLDLRHYQSVEYGLANSTLALLLRLAHIFNVDIAELLIDQE